MGGKLFHWIGITSITGSMCAPTHTACSSNWTSCWDLSSLCSPSQLGSQQTPQLAQQAAVDPNQEPQGPFQISGIQGSHSHTLDVCPRWRINYTVHTAGLMLGMVIKFPSNCSWRLNVALNFHSLSAARCDSYISSTNRNFLPSPLSYF